MRTFLITAIMSLAAGTAFAQQRPLVTEDPETIGAGRVLVEGGIEYAHDAMLSRLGPAGATWCGCRWSA